MSTYWYMECQSHNPPLASDFEISQHDDDYVTAAIEYASGADAWHVRDRMFGYNGMPDAIDPWLRAHEHCNIAAVSEYGEHRIIPGRSAEGTVDGYEKVGES